MASLPITVIANLGKVYGIDGGTATGVLEFDLLLNEAHNFQNTITQHPVEDGSVITDHIKNELISGSFSGMVSSHSIRLRTFSNFGDLVEDTFSFVDAEQKAFDTLEEIWKARTPVTITTLMRVYNNVGITNIRTSKSADDGRSITFEIGFRELKQVSLKRLQIEADIQVNDLDSDLSKQVAPAENAGRQIGG
jgi:hypothetical protein